MKHAENQCVAFSPSTWRTKSSVHKVESIEISHKTKKRIILLGTTVLCKIIFLFLVGGQLFSTPHGRDLIGASLVCWWETDADEWCAGEDRVNCYSLHKSICMELDWAKYDIFKVYFFSIFCHHNFIINIPPHIYIIDWKN